MSGVAGLAAAAGYAATLSNSADLYLGWSCAEHIDSGRIEVLRPTVFRAGGTLVVVRHLSGLVRLPRHDRLILVVDDDWHGGIRDRSLPWAYRLKLATVECRDALLLERRANILAVASEPLARRYTRRFPSRRVVRIDPAWPEAGPRVEGRPIADIAYLGSPAHAGDMPFVTGILALCLAARPELRVLVAGGHRLPAAWTARETITRLPDMSWSAYRDWLRGTRVGVMLYPLGPGRFNAARSVNKLMEADQVGAALLASGRWGAGRLAAAQGRCQLIDDRAEDWCQAVLDLVGHPERAARMARANRAALDRHNPLVAQRALWQGLLWGPEGT